MLQYIIRVAIPPLRVCFNQICLLRRGFVRCRPRRKHRFRTYTKGYMFVARQCTIEAFYRFARHATLLPHALTVSEIYPPALKNIFPATLYTTPLSLSSTH